MEKSIHQAGELGHRHFGLGLQMNEDRHAGTM